MTIRMRLAMRLMGRDQLMGRRGEETPVLMGRDEESYEIGYAVDGS